MQFQDMIENIPKSPGVYQMFDADGGLLYVGKAKNLWNRLHQYVNTDKLSYHIKLMRRLVAKVEFITTATESDALILESDMIKNKKPRFNILLTDDKMYPMLSLSADDFPRLIKFRGKADQKRDVFGPYSSIAALNETIKLIQKVCRIRTCTNSYMNNRARPCLLHQIGRCSAPCMIRDTDSSYRASCISYLDSVSLARKILSGNITPVINELAVHMDAAAESLDFEMAVKIRDQIKALSETAARGKKSAESADYFAYSFNDRPAVAIARVRSGQYLSHQIIYPKQTIDMTASEIMEQTILWFYSENAPTAKIISNTETPLLSNTNRFAILFRPNNPEIQKLLSQITARNRVFGTCEIKWGESVAELEKWLNIKLDRADVFDNSHLFGTNPVGAMIVFDSGGFVKKEYRHYKLEDKSRAGNDIGMMEEFLYRRYSHHESQITNHLLIVDGGRAQWNVAKKVLGKLGLDIPVLGVTKGEVRNGDEHFILPDGADDESVPKDSRLFLLLRAVRDEAHRFAINYHKKTRSRNSVSSELDEIDGIGPKRRKNLLRHFGSVQSMAGADIDAIARVPGISKQAAEKIYLHFHPDSIK
ncbi:MAG: excinuclease ABC subunit UvrC [Rickettsiales bacterium]|jgi:excinuclease ABC subunit C|nr:excinuclease ABC subunit UvrC [Rickettsiales bacterium]